MNVYARAAIGVGSVAVAGYGAKQFADLATSRTEKDYADLQRATADSRAQWEGWKAKLDTEFPGGALPTPQEHARFDQFLKENPPPSFVKVAHEEFTRIRLASQLPVDADLLPVEHQKSNGYPMMFGGMMALGGAAALAQGVARGAGSTLGTVGLIAGGALVAGFGVASAWAGVHGLRTGEGTDGASKLMAEINSY